MYALNKDDTTRSVHLRANPTTGALIVEIDGEGVTIENVDIDAGAFTAALAAAPAEAPATGSATDYMKRVAEAAEDTSAVPVSFGGTDSGGDPLPAGFDYLAESYTYDGSGNVQTIVKTSGANTYTQTLTYTDGQLSGVSQWVKA